MQRRHLLRTVGAASALGTGSASALAAQTDENGACALPDCVHPVLGYVGLDPDEAPPEGLEPDHAVAMEIRPRGDAEELSEEFPADASGIPEFVFEPTGLAVEAGDVIRFDAASPDHTVTAYHPRHGRQRRVPEGAAPFSSPVLPVESFWLYRFEESGVYDVYCAPHEIFGMAMRIVVDGGEANFGEAAYPEQRGPEFTAATVLDDDALAPQAIADEGTVSWDDLADESKALQIELVEAPADESGDGESDGDGGSGGEGEVAVGEEALVDGDLEITEHEFVVEEGLLQDATVRGLVENTGDDAYDGVEVQVTVYDTEGNQLDQYTDFTSDLSGGDSWRFEVMILEDPENLSEYDIKVEGTQF